MKKSLQLLCAGFVALLLCAGTALFSGFPVDTQPYVEKKYSGWNGVLQAWIYADWNPGGSFIRWLNHSASEFEKTHDGIYLEFIPVHKELLQNMDPDGMRMPDLVFFSPGVISNQDVFMDLNRRTGIRRDMINYGNGKAIPVAIGGYIWAYNTSLLSNVPQNPADFSTCILPEDIPAAVLIGLLSGSPGEPSEDTGLPDFDIDLGLPVSNRNISLYSTDAIDRFIKGELPCIPVDAAMLARLDKLRANGKGPAWSTAVSGNLACTGQILLAAVPIHEEREEQTMLAEEFISFLLETDAQDALADIGAFSVSGKRIHSDYSVYGKIDALLNQLPLWAPDCFSEYSVSNQEGIVRGFLRGEFSAKKALSLLGFEGV